MPSTFSDDDVVEKKENINYSLSQSLDNDFICGVVEGFYGRPWTTEQRKDLFSKMENWGLNSYLYAPKDDCKHRAFWRELYTVEEAEHLSSLISLASQSGITFYYAISPGLDIVYSSSKDASSLKRKLDQVSQLGCPAFALLFDDIESEMSKQDKEVFQSFGHAQVSITNDIFEHLSQPKFLFCPTQYCSIRAVPSIRSSEYLSTIGSQLAPEIQIMWTGDKVISKTIDEESLEDITDILRRPVVIWDNQHANDYDLKRVYLGPYSGRSPTIKRKLNGVMSNPNCEFGANFIAIHTLAQWSKCSVDGVIHGISSDVKLEIESDIEESQLFPSHVYQPGNALRLAIREWTFEFSRHKEVWGPMSKPQVGLTPPIVVPSLNTCMSTMTSTTTTTSIQSSSNTLTPNEGSSNTSTLTSPSSSSLATTMTTTIMPIMNSLVSSDKVVLDNSLAIASEVLPLKNGFISIQPPLVATLGESTTPLEPMDQDSTDNLKGGNDIPMESLTGPSTPASVMDSENNQILTREESTGMLLEIESSEIMSTTESLPSFLSSNPLDTSNNLNEDELHLLCHLFFLPSEHGQIGIELLNDVYWLKRNAKAMLPTDGSLEDKIEWEDKAKKFMGRCDTVKRIFKKLCLCPNRELVYDLYTYLWDMYTVLQTLEGYILWLAKGVSSPKAQNYVIGQQTWFSGVREAFLSGDHEPWVFRGGLASDLQRLLPMDSGQDLYLYKHPDVPTNIFYRVRPYETSDESALYTLAYDNYGLDNPLVKTLIGDKVLGAFLTLYPKHCFVCETEESGKKIIGYGLCTPNISEFQIRHDTEWLPAMRIKYPLSKDPLIESFYGPESHWKIPSICTDVSVSLWGHLSMNLSSFIHDHSLPKRLVMLVLASLRTSGTFRVYVETPTNDVVKRNNLLQLGFQPVNQDSESNILIRNF